METLSSFSLIVPNIGVPADILRLFLAKVEESRMPSEIRRDDERLTNA